MPIKLRMGSDNKKEIVGGLSPNNAIQYKKGMKNFAIYMPHYPDIVVLDLDTRDHKLDFYKDKTYTHKTRKGWHCFFYNTFNMDSKRQFNKDKFDILCGPNWIFYNYNNPDVAQYLEYNQLPIVDFPQELYDTIKTTIPGSYTKDAGRFIVAPIIDRLRKISNLYNPGNKKVQAHWHNDAMESSEFSLAVVKETLPYTDIPEHHVSILTQINNEAIETNGQPVMSEKQFMRDDLVEGKLKKGKAEFWLTRSVNWRPLSDFRIVFVGGKKQYLDIDNRKIVDKSYIDTVANPTYRPIDILDRFVPKYDDTEFLPHEEDIFVKDTYNLFHGFIGEQVGNDHELFLQYVMTDICSGNELYYNYIIEYLAHMVQYPNQLPGVAIVLHGTAKGTGKDSLHKLVGRLFKKGGYVYITKQMLDRFNGPLQHCLLGGFEELTFGGSHKDDDNMKTLITRERHPIEHKGINGTVEVKNYIRLIITSNKPQPVKATEGERRYFVLEPSEIHKGDKEYWKALNKSFDKDKAAQNLLYYLRRLEIKTFEPNCEPPITNELLDLIEESLDPIESVLIEWWNTTYKGYRFTAKDLYLELGFDDKYFTHHKLTRRIKSLLGKDSIKKGSNADLGNHLIVVDRPERIIDANN